MSARFRIVHFMPDPFSGSRVPIAALVQGPDRRVRVARAPGLPGPACIGGRASWSALQMALQDLEHTSSFDEVPASVGPHVTLDEERPIPDSVPDATRWVESFVLPQRLVHGEDQGEQRPRAPQRRAHGAAFFKTWRVDTWVRSSFDGEGLGVHADVAHQITHWVPGRDELMLMEPVVGTRETLTADLRDISQTFLAWRAIFHNHHIARAPRFVAYVLDSHRGAASYARELLAEARAEVVDVGIPNERDGLLEAIRRVGRSSGEQGGLPLN